METNTILAIFFGVIALLFIIVTFRNNGIHKDECHQYDTALDNQRKERIKRSEERTGIERRLESALNRIAQYDVSMDMIEQNLLKNLRFVDDKGTIMNNVKVKTIRKKDEVLGVTATIRRYVSGKSSEVKVKPIIVRPS